jgi:aminomethyltransferase
MTGSDHRAAGLARLKLHDLHLSLGARMVPFAGYEMPVQYEAGVMAEHLHTRSNAGLFDVSHMGQVILRPKAGMEPLLRAFEALVPVDALGLAAGRQRYGFFTNDQGGIMDDLMFTHRGDHLLVVVNAACKAADIAHMEMHLSDDAEIIAMADRALLAVQGPAAAGAVGALLPGAAAMRFLDATVLPWQGQEIWISRSGYTGEDGFEISIPEAAVEAFARALLAQEGVAPVGLGARDSLRLEAGLCLYGQDIDSSTSPVEAGLVWAIQKVRRDGGARAAGFPGAARILAELADGPERLRVGLLPQGRAPMRAGTALYAGDGTPVGEVTSGGFAPTLGVPVAMGYVARAFAGSGTALEGEVRGKRLPVTVAPLPFVPAGFKR